MIDLPPDMAVQHTPVVIAQASQAKDSFKTDRTIGVCHLINPSPEAQLGAVNHFSPLRSVEYYLNTVEQKYPELKGKVTLLQGPEHGTTEMGTTGGRYHPKQHYVGLDHATFLVEIGGLKVKAIYFFNVMEGAGGGTDGYDPYKDRNNCPNGPVWKISLNTK
jgi:hypothetical protein